MRTLVGGGVRGRAVVREKAARRKITPVFAMDTRVGGEIVVWPFAMAATKSLLPDCGLYRTTKALPEHESEVPAGVLVYFHNHSDSGLPVVVVPDHNVNNRWHFHSAGIPFRGLSWADSLTKLPAEGFYMLRKALSFEGGEWPKAALVQLGYTKAGDPILFIGQMRAQLEENDLFFSDRGVSITREQLAMLEPLQVFIEPTPAGGHSAGVH